VNLDDALRTFLAESRGLLHEMEDALTQRVDVLDDEAVHAAFRAAHTIKGSAGLFGLDDIVAFTHHLEGLLDAMRDGRVQAGSDTVSLLLACADHIGHLLDHQDSGHTLSPPDLARGQDLAHRLDAAASITPCAQVPLTPDGSPTLQAGAGSTWHVTFKPCKDLFREGFDPASFIHHLRTVGTLAHVSTEVEAVPPLENLDAESCHLGFEVVLTEAAEREKVEAVFDFVRELAEIGIEAPEPGVSDPGAAPIAPPPEPQEMRKRVAPDTRLIRVQAEKLDALITQVGELIVASAAVGSRAQQSRDRGLAEAISVMSRLTEEVRDGAMRLRMVEIGETFQRFRRIVRDVARELGKDIELQVHGGETELDKSVVERIADPLTHLVRNAIDHGIEPASERIAHGKPGRGRLVLSARHEGGAIVLEISDDGGGLNRERILAKAVQKGLIEADSLPTDQEVWSLIFEPGFSTAERVSAISGRGVGMDVVRSSIEALRGTIELDSRPGQGTTFRIRLPLTLAIIDGFLLSVGKGHYVVPLDMVLECGQLDPRQGRSGLLDMRGEALPLLRLRDHFALDAAPPRRENVVVVQCGARKAGLVVDNLRGEFQAVIKPLGPLMEGVEGLSGSTILGTGEVALVLDIPALLQQAAATDAPA
jgi:two-component system chemotaxis sensor kinase CheA